jgi:hypothetical protein
MQKVLIIGVITLPLLLFLAFFSENVMSDAESNASTAKTAADELMDTVTE